MQQQITFEDLDAKCMGLAFVRREGGVVGLALNLVGVGDFRVYLAPEKARELAEALIRAAHP